MAGDKTGTPALDHEARVKLQQAELEGVKQLNNVLESVIHSLEGAQNKMEHVADAVGNSHKLLDLWVKILSQTEHTQRLIQSGHWEGVTKELADMEAEAEAKKLKAARQAQEARERAEREAAAAEARRLAAEKKPARGHRRGASSSRGVPSSSRTGSRGGSTRGVPGSRFTRGGTYGSTRGRGGA